jgi:hypothetical protein
MRFCTWHCFDAAALFQKWMFQVFELAGFVTYKLENVTEDIARWKALASLQRFTSYMEWQGDIQLGTYGNPDWSDSVERIEDREVTVSQNPARWDWMVVLTKEQEAIGRYMEEGGRACKGDIFSTFANDVLLASI